MILKENILHWSKSVRGKKQTESKEKLTEAALKIVLH